MLCFLPGKMRRHGGFREVTAGSLGRVVATLWPSVVVFLTGFIVITVLTDLPKAAVGRLRPHFLSVCKPAYQGACTPTRGYILNYTCTDPAATADQLHEMR